MTTIPSITICTDLLAAVAKWAGTDASRPQFEFVVFRDNEVAATDGHRLVRIPYPTRGLVIGVHRSHLLAAAAAQQMVFCGVPLDHNGNRAVVVSWSYKQITIDLGPIKVIAPAGDISTYPPLDKFTPTAQPDQPPSPDRYVLNPRYLAAIDEVIHAMGDREHGVKCVAWSAPHGGDAMRFDSRSGAKFVIMPMRDTHGGDE